MDKLDQIRATNSCVKGGGRTYLQLITQLETLFPDLKKFFRYTETKTLSGFVVKTFTTDIKGTRQNEMVTFAISRGEHGPEITYSCSLHGTRIIKTSKTDHAHLFTEGNVFLDLLVLCEAGVITP